MPERGVDESRGRRLQLPTRRVGLAPSAIGQLCQCQVELNLIALAAITLPSPFVFFVSTRISYARGGIPLS